jgi:hypothetical protein
MAMDYGFPCLSFGELEKTLLGTPKLQMFIVEPESSGKEFNYLSSSKFQ